jgi:hypothetical protein
MSIETSATVDGDRLNVTVERQVAQFGDHTTVRAHLSVSVPQPDPDETVADYQTRISNSVRDLAFPLKEAVLIELGLPYTIDEGIIHEAIQVEKSSTTPFAPAEQVPYERPAPKFNQAPSSGPTTNSGNVKVMEKGAGGGDKYGKVDPTNLSYSADLNEAMAAAEAGGADTLWTGVTRNRRWYRFNNELWNKPEAVADFVDPGNEPF